MANESSIKLQSYAEAVVHILICHGVSREIVPGHFVGILRPGVCAVVASEASIVTACLL